MEHKRHRPADHTGPSEYRPEEREYGNQYSETPSLRRRKEGSSRDDRYRRGGEATRDSGRREAESSQESRHRRPDGTAGDRRRTNPERSRRVSAETAGRNRGREENRAEGRKSTSSGNTRGDRSRNPNTTDRKSVRRSAETGSSSAQSAGREKTRSGNANATRKENTAPKVLSERSVNAAKKRKAIRAENARLSRLRERQKRKAKRRIVKRIDKGLFKRLTIMVFVIIAVLLSMVIFFRVESIQIRGATYYSEEEILEVCGVATGDNLLTLSRGEISGNIMAPLKYVETVKVSRQLPNTLIIRVTESDPQYAVQDANGNYFLMTAQGRIVEQIVGNRYKDFTVIEGLTIDTPVIGEDANIYAKQGEETKAKGQLSAMKKILTEIEAASLGRHIASVQIPSAYKLTLWYEDRFLVELGDTERMDYKLEYLKAVIEKEESYVTGTIDLTLKDGDKAILRRGE